MTDAKRSLLQVHLAVFLFGLAGLFGKFLAVPATTIVLGRTGFASLALWGFLAYRRQSIWPQNRRDLAGLLLLGALLAFHWVAFFHAIQISTVAIGLLTFSSFPMFVTVLEPWWFKSPLRWRDGLSAIAILIGVALVVPSYDLADRAVQGAIWGLLSGLSFAVLNLFNRGYVQRYSPEGMAFYQNAIACLCLLPLGTAPILGLSIRDWGLLGVLGIACTALAHTLFIASLQRIRAQVASVISGLEPVYGIALAVVLLEEPLNLRTVLGGGLIVGVTVAATVISGRSSSNTG
ncbi:MAG: DMT family transporter [Cyanobacteria bacterium P01_A01_bin.123]